MPNLKWRPVGQRTYETPVTKEDTNYEITLVRANLWQASFVDGAKPKVTLIGMYKWLHAAMDDCFTHAKENA